MVFFLRLLCNTVLSHCIYGQALLVTCCNIYLSENKNLLNTTSNNNNNGHPNNINFVINQNPVVRREMGAIIKSRESDIDLLLDNTRVMISEKGHKSTAGLLFSKGAFSSVPKLRNKNQRCGARGCKCCRIINNDKDTLDRISSITNQRIIPDHTLNCKSSNVIYIFTM